MNPAQLRSLRMAAFYGMSRRRLERMALNYCESAIKPWEKVPRLGPLLLSMRARREAALALKSAERDRHLQES